MLRRSPRTGLGRQALWIGAAAFAVVSPALAQFPQPEMPVMVAEGATVTLGYGQHTVGPTLDSFALIDFPGDVDTFDFNYTEGEVVRIIVRTYSGSLDPLLRVFDLAQGTFLTSLAMSCNGNTGFNGAARACSYVAVFGDGMNPPVSGTYRLFMSDDPALHGGMETGSYAIQIERIPATSFPSLVYGATVTDTIDPATDIDFINIPVGQGSFVNVFVSTPTGSLDPTIELFDPSGDPVSTTASTCNGNTGFNGSARACSYMFDLTPAETLTGDYTLLVRDSGHNERGTYTVLVQCLVPPPGATSCPASPAALELSITQPNGPGTVLVEVTNGTPNTVFLTAVSFDPLNSTVPPTGWWGGLHISIFDFANLVFIGPPFFGFLDGNGQYSFSLPAGLPSGLPTMYGVTRTFGPGFQTLTATSARISVLLQ